MQPDQETAGILTIHARATRHAEDERAQADHGSILLRPGHAWLEYRARGVTTTFSEVGDFFRRDEELGLYGEATRETPISGAQEQLLFQAVARREQSEGRRGFCSCTSTLDSARFAALIWRVVTREPLRSAHRGFFNPSTLAESIERMNARERFIGFGAYRGEVCKDSEHEEEQERNY